MKFPKIKTTVRVFSAEISDEQKEQIIASYITKPEGKIRLAYAMAGKPAPPTWEIRIVVFAYSLGVFKLIGVIKKLLRKRKS
jgi:hypothetical protein